MANTTINPYLKRLLIVFLLSLGFVIVFNEITFILQKDQSDRAPKTVQLIIPDGTSARVSAGEDTPSIPDEIIFVLGDVLEVRNDDSISHQLGPVWVPPGATGKLVMETVDKWVYTCSFQTSRYLGLDVRQPTTWATRAVGIGIATPTMTALIFIYSLAAYPIEPKKLEKEKLNENEKP
jgi:hypothetical protein